MHRNNFIFIALTGMFLAVSSLGSANPNDSLFLEITAKVEAFPEKDQGLPVVLHPGEIFPETGDYDDGKIIRYGDKPLRIPYKNKQKATSYKKLYEQDSASYSLLLEDLRWFVETYHDIEKLGMVSKASDTEFKVDVSSLKKDIGRDKTVLLANRLDKEALTLQKASVGTIKMNTVGDYFRLIVPGYPSIVYTPTDIEAIKNKIIEPPPVNTAEEEPVPESGEPANSEDKAADKKPFWPYLLIFLALLATGIISWYRKGRKQTNPENSNLKTNLTMSDMHHSKKDSQSLSADMPAFEEFSKLIDKLDQQENRTKALHEKVERIASSTQTILDQIKAQKTGDKSADRFQIRIEELEKENLELRAVADSASSSKLPEGVIYWEGYKEFGAWDTYLNAARKIESEVTAFVQKVHNRAPESPEAFWLTAFQSKFLQKKPAEAIGRWQGQFSVMLENNGLVVDKEARKRLKSGLPDQQMKAMNKLFFDQVLNPYISALLIFVEETRKLKSFVQSPGDIAEEATSFDTQFSMLFNQTESKGIRPMKVELFEKTFDIKGEFKMAGVEELSPSYRKLQDVAPKQTVLEILSYGFAYGEIFNQESRIIEA